MRNSTKLNKILVANELLLSKEGSELTAIVTNIKTKVSFIAYGKNLTDLIKNIIKLSPPDLS